MSDELKTEYKYLFFEEDKVIGKKTREFTCWNHQGNYALGTVKWYSPWRQYCYFAEDDTAVYSKGCLDDISNFLDQLNMQWRSIKKEVKK